MAVRPATPRNAAATVFAAALFVALAAPPASAQIGPSSDCGSKRAKVETRGKEHVVVARDLSPVGVSCELAGKVAVAWAEKCQPLRESECWLTRNRKGVPKAARGFGCRTGFLPGSHRRGWVFCGLPVDEPVLTPPTLPRPTLPPLPTILPELPSPRVMCWEFKRREVVFAKGFEKARGICPVRD